MIFEIQDQHKCDEIYMMNDNAKIAAGNTPLVANDNAKVRYNRSLIMQIAYGV